jgi:RNA polymerase sigma-70 factor (ECF subfamily)
MANVQPNGRPEYRRPDFERELENTRPRLMAFARSLTKSFDYSEDLVQETMTKALKAWESFTPGTSMEAWCFTILRNQFFHEKRRSWRSVPSESEHIEFALVEGITAEREAGSTQELKMVLSVLESLPQHMRDAMIAVGILGMDYEESALALSCPAGTIKSRVSRGRQEILSQLGGWPPSPLHPCSGGPEIKVYKNHPYFPVQQAHDLMRAELGLEPVKRIRVRKK